MITSLRDLLYNTTKNFSEFTYKGGICHLLITHFVMWPAQILLAGNSVVVRRHVTST